MMPTRDRIGASLSLVSETRAWENDGDSTPKWIHPWFILLLELSLPGRKLKNIEANRHNVMKKMMKNLTAAMILGGTIMASCSVFAQVGTSVVAGDLYLGFQNQAGGGTEDYIINLGTTNSIGVGGNVVKDLSSDFSLSNFKSTGLSGTNTSAIYGGVVGGQISSGSKPAEMFLTQTRAGGAGNPAVAGSSITGKSGTTIDAQAFDDISQIDCPAAGAGVLDANKTWESFVEPGNGAGSFVGDTGFQPDTSFNTNTVLYEDLWFSASSGGLQPFTYLGFFTLNLTGGGASLTFTPVNAPAPLTPPTIVSISLSGTTATVVASNAVATHNYQLQRTASLSPVSWSNVGSPVPASGTTVTLTDTGATGSQWFYRVTTQ
jgi:hypothetical protein